MASFTGKHIKVALGLPWYDGADKDCLPHFLTFQHYLGRLQERTEWLSRLPPACRPADLSKLDPVNSTGFSELPEALAGTRLEFGIADEGGLSLPGLARERIVDKALEWGADYVFFYDDDMIFGTDLFLRLLLDDVPVVAALAFTSRKPITPVVYRSTDTSERRVDGIPAIRRHFEPCDYLPDQLQRVDAVGSGVMLIKREVFERLEKPWFHSTGCGEDIFFTGLRCYSASIPVYVDTRAKTIHKPVEVERWHDELLYRERMTERQ